MLKRNPEKYPSVGAQWDIVGGRIKPGVNLLENLKREVKEETSLDLLNEVRLVAAQDIFSKEGNHIVRLTYLSDIDGEPKLDEDHIEYKWFKKDELLQLKDNELDRYFKELLDKNII